MPDASLSTNAVWSAELGDLISASSQAKNHTQCFFRLSFDLACANVLCILNRTSSGFSALRLWRCHPSLNGHSVIQTPLWSSEYPDDVYFQMPKVFTPYHALTLWQASVPAQLRTKSEHPGRTRGGSLETPHGNSPHMAQGLGSCRQVPNLPMSKHQLTVEARTETKRRSSQARDME